ncbi:MAG: 4-hydroxy-tetrahydrodipicolinate reductase [bacterium]|nr:4-hydroxy-tetrahydrodipicolinate reductase [bacterium]
MAINIIVVGAAGKMGREIIKIIREKKHALTAAIDQFNDPSADPTGLLIENNLERRIKDSDVTVEFTSAAATMEHIKINEKHGKPAVIGTTGLSTEQVSQIRSAASAISVVFSPNMSIGVNLLFKLTELAAKIIRDDFDAEVLEAHHHFKKDAPSGTAMKLVEILAKELGRDMKKDIVYGREGLVGERKKREIGVMSIRAGDIVGEHTVLLAGQGERIELIHRATDRSSLARGAVLAAEWVVKQKPGLYSMYDVLGL